MCSKMFLFVVFSSSFWTKTEHTHTKKPKQNKEDRHRTKGNKHSNNIISCCNNKWHMKSVLACAYRPLYDTNVWHRFCSERHCRAASSAAHDGSRSIVKLRVESAIQRDEASSSSSNCYSINSKTKNKHERLITYSEYVIWWASPRSYCVLLCHAVHTHTVGTHRQTICRRQWMIYAYYSIVKSIIKRINGIIYISMCCFMRLH